MKHTPEPWSWTDTHPMSHDSWFVLLDSNGRGPIMDVGGNDVDGQIAEAKHMITDPEEIEANACRIVVCVNACASIEDPSIVGKLLEALKLVTAKIDDASGSPSFTAEEHDKLETIIAKAKGK